MTMRAGRIGAHRVASTATTVAEPLSSLEGPTKDGLPSREGPGTVFRPSSCLALSHQLSRSPLRPAARRGARGASLDLGPAGPPSRGDERSGSRKLDEGVRGG
ncbi:hypothetical protein KM043_000200 [Ampulex compressa]|nr:hypothetical protein KM043_000200 [Ampulex compressa]